MRALLLLVGLVGALGDLPALRPRKNTIACADPLAAQDFTLKYIGGEWTEQLVDGGNGSCATIKWVDFTPWDAANVNNTQFHWHFVETSRKPTGPMSLVQLHGYLEWLHGNLSQAANPADQLADSHITLAAGSLDAFAALYRRDSVPFSARERYIPSWNLTLYSVLIEVPHGILVEIVSDTFDTFAEHSPPMREAGFEPLADDPCAPRHIPTSTRAYFENLRQIKPFSSEGLPPVWPYSMSYASSRPAEAVAFVHEYMGGSIVDQELPDDCNETIQIGLAEFVGAEPYPFYVQFLYHPQARAGYFPLRGIENYLELLHGNLTEDHYDQYMDDHLGMESVVRGDESFGAFYDVWESTRVPWFHRMASWDGVDSFLMSPGGIILEVMVAEANGEDFGLPIVNWDICSPLPVPLPRIPMPDQLA